MIFLSAAFAIAAFVFGFQTFGIVRTARRIVEVARHSGATMSDKSLDDDAKEKAIQAAALSMLGGAVAIFFKIAALLAVTVAPIYLFSILGLANAQDTFAFLARIDVIIGATILVGGAMWILSKRPKRAAKSGYSLMDKLVHRIAFAAPFVQAAAADVEDGVFSKDIEGIEDSPPVFITSLPRAGTTVMLNALHDVPGMATHLYRDMPFIMAPLFWSRLSGGFQKDQTLQERAHGDGLTVGYDSPEAFEEVIWRNFWPNHFRQSDIALWNENDRDGEATDFFRRHFRKIISLRSGSNGRYISKNNGNIARIDLIGATFSDAALVVPIREPAEHAASLLRQHQNFLEQHKKDAFVRRYMRDIGHYDFGMNHRPIAFAGMGAIAKTHSPTDPDYWLGYWIAAMTHVKARAKNLIIVDQQKLQTEPQATMTRVCTAANIDPAEADFAPYFKVIPPRADQNQFDPDLLHEAVGLFEDLRRLSI